MSIEKALEAIEKKFGSEVVMKYGSKPKIKPKVISTSIPSLDKALGVGGLPLGRIVEVYGPESSGKTTLALTVMAQAQRDGYNVAFIDAEHALDPVYAQNIGVDMDNVLISQPDSGEQALQVAEALINTGEVSMIVIDSVAALVPRSELDGEIGDAAVGKQAKLMAQAMRMLVPIAAKNDCLIVFINQLREKIGVMFGSPEITPGGKSLKFSASIRLDIRRIGAIKGKVEGQERNVGNQTRVKVVKNKVAPPHKEVEFEIIYGEGISREADLLDAAIAKEVIGKNGNWFTFQGENIANGREKAKLALKDVEFFTKVSQAVSALT